MKRLKLTMVLITIYFLPHYAASSGNEMPIDLQHQSGFFRFTTDNIKMPNHIQNMGLLSVNYFMDINPLIYGGLEGYGAVTGSQGGFFVLGVGGGLHQEFIPHWWADIGLDAGGGGGGSSLVGGGLMLQPHVGIEYRWKEARFGLHYSYIKFPDGLISSSSVGLDFSLPVNFYYTAFQNSENHLFTIKNNILPLGNYLNFQRNDFAIILQAYKQRAGTLDTRGAVQDGTIGLVGAELDHYISDTIFWYVKSSGAYTGIPNGYMDVLGGFGYHRTLFSNGFALVPQLGLGAGGGGTVDTGSGFIMQPQLGIEQPLTSHFAARLSGGYLWAPQGQLSAVTATGELIYHLDIATAGTKALDTVNNKYEIQGWRLQLFNQTYIHPQRSYPLNTSINLIAFQIDQIFTPNFFCSYQAASSYQGEHSGGYATGMIGPGLQSTELFNKRARLFAELLIGAGGGGSLAVGGGALIEPVVGLHYILSPALSLQTSVGQIKAIQNQLNTPVVNLGLTVRFGTINHV